MCLDLIYICIALRARITTVEALYKINDYGYYLRMAMELGVVVSSTAKNMKKRQGRKMFSLSHDCGHRPFLAVALLSVKLTFWASAIQLHLW